MATAARLSYASLGAYARAAGGYSDTVCPDAGATRAAAFRRLLLAAHDRGWLGGSTCLDADGAPAG